MELMVTIDTSVVPYRNRERSETVCEHSQSIFIIDREAKEIIRLVASVRPSVRPFVNMTHGIQTTISVCLSVIR